MRYYITYYSLQKRELKNDQKLENLLCLMNNEFSLVLKRYKHFIELEKVTCTNKLLLSYSNEVIKISITDFKRRLLSLFLSSQSSVIDSAIYILQHKQKHFKCVTNVIRGRLQ
jgi:hypothetical protein